MGEAGGRFARRWLGWAQGAQWGSAGAGLAGGAAASVPQLGAGGSSGGRCGPGRPSATQPYPPPHPCPLLLRSAGGAARGGAAVERGGGRAGAGAAGRRTEPAPGAACLFCLVLFCGKEGFGHLVCTFFFFFLLHLLTATAGAVNGSRRQPGAADWSHVSYVHFLVGCEGCPRCGAPLWSRVGERH